MSNVVGGLMSPPYEAFINEKNIQLTKADKHIRKSEKVHTNTYIFLASCAIIP